MEISWLPIKKITFLTTLLYAPPLPKGSATMRLSKALIEGLKATMCSKTTFHSCEQILSVLILFMDFTRLNYP